MAAVRLLTVVWLRRLRRYCGGVVDDLQSLRQRRREHLQRLLRCGAQVHDQVLPLHRHPWSERSVGDLVPLALMLKRHRLLSALASALAPLRCTVSGRVRRGRVMANAAAPSRRGASRVRRLHHSQ